MGPSEGPLDPSDRRLAVHVEDHPVDYGGFEGTIGVHNDVGELVDCGKVGTGFDFASAADLRARLDRLTTTKNPFTRRPPAALRTLFVRPELVAEVSFANWTRDGRMRHPVFEGLREDKRAADVHRERPAALRPRRQRRRGPLPLYRGRPRPGRPHPGRHRRAVHLGLDRRPPRRARPHGHRPRPRQRGPLGPRQGDRAGGA